MKICLAWLLVFWALLFSIPTIQAQSFDFDDNWDDRFYINGLDGIGNCSLIYQGQVILGGDFHHAGPLRAYNIVGWDPSTRQFFPLGDGFRGQVTSLATYQGDLVARYKFRNTSGNYVAEVARWDGEGWSVFGEGLPIYSRGLIEFQGILYTNRHRLEGDQWVDFTQAPGITAMAVHEGKLVFAGAFSQLRGVAAEGAASWDGVSVQPMDTGLNPDVENLHVAGGVLYSTSAVTSYVYDPYYDLVQRWNGSSWQNENFVIEGVQGGVEWVTLGDFNNQLVVMVGMCGDADCWVFSGTRNGWSWEDFPLFTGYGPITVNSMQEAGGRLLLVGSLVGTSDFPSRNIIEVDGAGAYPLVENGQGLSGPSLSLCAFQGDMAVGGNFDSAGTVVSSGAARWDGAIWHPMNQAFNNGYGHPVSYYDGFDNLASDGDILIGNYLHWYNFHQHPTFSIWNDTDDRWDYSVAGVDGLAVWNGEIFGFDGSDVLVLQDGAWVTVGSSNGSVWNMEALADGLVVAGFFDEMNGIQAGGLARWDGSSWSAVGDDLAGPGRAVCEFQGQPVVAFGNGYGSFVATWNGTSWESMGGMFLGNINFLEPFGDHLYAGGSMTIPGDESRGNLAYWDGQSWSSYGNGLNGEVKGMEALEGKLYLAGDFTEAGNMASSGVACLLGPLPTPAPVEMETVVPGGLELEGAFPNPFNPRTTIGFRLESDSPTVRLRVYDVAGRLINTLLEGALSAGDHQVIWQGTDTAGRAVASGVYYCCLEVGGTVVSRPMVLAR